MMNIDGVIHGCTRRIMFGKDLNREWIRPNKITEPCIYDCKKLIDKNKVFFLL
jgi:hypothetical protein